MSQFLKIFLASLLAIVVSIIIAFLIFALIIGGLTSGKNEKSVKEGSALILKLDREIVDRASESDFQFDPGTFQPINNLGLNTIIEQIHKAKDDDRIKGIVLDLTELKAGLSAIEEIRDELKYFKTSGKWIYSYSDYMSQGAYYLASVSDSIFLNPEGEFIFKGLATNMVFMKGMFDKLDIEFEVIRPTNNKFKSAVEPFILDKMSDANREQVERFVNGIWDHIVSNISESRGLSIEQLNLIADNIQTRYNEKSVELGMIDVLNYRDEFSSFIDAKLGVEDKKDSRLVGLKEYKKAYVKNEDKPNKRSKERVAIIYASGDIHRGESDLQSIGSSTFAEAIKSARKDENVKAVVLRVNSGGGDALASDIIWREMVLCKKEKPVVVSMGDVAASGGYYISCGADRIFASKNTITGSIGVFGLIPNMGEFFEDKIGVTFDGVESNELSDTYTGTKPMEPEQKELYQNFVDDIYSDFLGRVAEGRGIPVNEVDEIAQGRVWTGSDALELGLIDQIGGLDVAIDTAVALAGISDYRLKLYPEEKDPIQEILENFSAKTQVETFANEISEEMPVMKEVMAFKELIKMKSVQARMTYLMDIKF